jgi:hypothetical protein
MRRSGLAPVVTGPIGWPAATRRLTVGIGQATRRCSRRTRARRSTAVAAALAVLAATGLSGCSRGPAHTVVYDVLEADLVGALPTLPDQDIIWSWTTGSSQGPDGGGRADEGTPLPWKHTETVHGDLYELTLQADLDVPTGTDESRMPTVQCRITVDGTVVLVQNAPGAIQCDAQQDLIRQKLS